ncbi:MAG: hypothetical protein RJB39_628 [Candidatus Parcubacteria bacterium]|jgi:hypothetical protein
MTLRAAEIGRAGEFREGGQEGGDAADEMSFHMSGWVGLGWPCHRPLVRDLAFVLRTHVASL